MFRLYIVRGLELGKGDTCNVTVDHHTKKGNKTIRIGQTSSVKDDKTNNYWIFDEEHESMFFYPFIDADDSKIILSVYKIRVMKSKKLIGTAEFELSKVRYEFETEIPIIQKTESDKINPRIIIFVETYFSYLLKKMVAPSKKPQQNPIIKEKNRIFKNINYLYVYLECPRNDLNDKAKPELQIYECSTEDGGYSNLIGRTTPKKSDNKSSFREIIIKKQNFKYPITQNGCTQLYFFNVNEVALSDEFLYVPLIRTNTLTGTYAVNYAFYSFSYFPTMSQNKEGYYDFAKLGIKPFKPHLIQQDIVYCPTDDLYTGIHCFTFGPVADDDSKYEFKSYQMLQDHQQGLKFDDFAKNIRVRILPSLNVFKRLVLNPNKLYSLRKVFDFHHRSFLMKLRINLTWKCKADLDLSLCALNKNIDCVGHVSFKDRFFFENRSIKHERSFREEIPENGGHENCTIKIVKLPHQVKTILIVITSYKKIPFNRLTPAPIIRMYDNTNKSDMCELMYYQLSSISNGTGALFAALQRTRGNEWYIVPLQIYCNESKPYDAHRVLIEKIKNYNYISEFITNHQNDLKDEN